MGKKLKQIVEGYSNWVKSLVGKEPVDEQVVADKRYEICKACKHKTAANTCSLCGCFLPSKTRCADCECPLEYW